MPDYAYDSCAGMWMKRMSNPDSSKLHMNVYGIVRDPTAVSKTRGSDSKMTLKIFDESTTTEEVSYGSKDDVNDIPSEIPLMFFDANPYELPRPADGDIIRVHRVQAQMYNGRPQFIAKTGKMLNYGHSKTAWCLFRGDDDSEEPYAMSSERSSAPDVGRVRELRAYARRAKSMPFMSEFGNTMGASKQRRICDIKQEEFFDVYCLIIDAYFVPGTEASYVMMVWDGTDVPPLPPSMTTALSQQREEMDPSLLELESELDKRQFYSHGFDPRGQEAIPEGEMNTAVPLIGSALPVFMHGTKLDLDEIPSPGEWIKIRNLNTQVVKGQLQGFVSPGTSFIRNKAPLPAILQAYNLRKQQNLVASWGAPGHSTNITVTKHPNMRYSTIREMLMSKPPNRHKLRVIVRGFSPDLVDMCQPVKGSKNFEFGVRFRIIDATDSVDVNLCGEEAALFFHNIVPTDLTKPSSTRERLAKAMKKLLKHDSIEESAPWIDLCVMQYIIRDKKSSRRVFQAFGTSMIS